MKKGVYSVPLVLGGALLLLLLASTAHLPVGAQSTSLATESAKEPEEKVRLFFEDIRDDKASKAFADLLRGSSASTEQVTEMKTKLDDVKKQCGTFRKFEKIGVKPVGEDLVFVRYLLKCDRYPFLGTFTFYRRPTESGSLSTAPWFVIGLRFDTNLDPLIEGRQDQR